MSKRLLTLFTIVLLLGVFSVAQAQQPTASDEPILVLTEAQINEGFRIPSTSSRRISNLEVDVQDDGIHISFDMTTIKDGTSNTVNIIAVLIGLYQPERQQMMWSFADLLVTSVRATGTQRRELMNLIGGAWRNYLADVADVNVRSLNFTKITFSALDLTLEVETFEAESVG